VVVSDDDGDRMYSFDVDVECGCVSLVTFLVTDKTHSLTHDLGYP
jgi:hypothetical protein